MSKLICWVERINISPLTPKFGGTDPRHFSLDTLVGWVKYSYQQINYLRSSADFSNALIKACHATTLFENDLFS